MRGFVLVLGASVVLPGYLLFNVCLALNGTEIAEILEIHNYYRRLMVVNATEGASVANMNKLLWSTRLQTEAERQITCEMGNDAGRRSLGNNAAAGKSVRKKGPIAMIIKSWFAQIRVYNQTSNECRPWYRCQRFRTMINALQHSIGCAKIMNCNLPRRSLVLLCLYNGGSTEGFDFDFRFGAACSKCEWPRTFCDNNLCASCESDDPGLCDCRKTCLKEGVGVGILHRQNCTCQCQYGLGPNCDGLEAPTSGLETASSRISSSILNIPLCIEPCINPIYYSDNFDPCTAVNPATIDCAIMGEFCPRQCLCRPFPNASETLEK